MVGTSLRSLHLFAVLIIALGVLSACSNEADAPEPQTIVVDHNDVLTRRQVHKLEAIEPAHDGPTYVVMRNGKSLGTPGADRLIRDVIDDCPEEEHCEASGVFILISRSGPPQLRVGSDLSKVALEHGTTYGPNYLAEQDRQHHRKPFKQARSLAASWDEAVAQDANGFFLSSHLEDAVDGLLVPNFGIGTGWTSRLQRGISETTGSLFDRDSGPLEAIVGFTLIGFVIRFLLRLWGGWGAAVARLIFAITYVALSIPFSLGVITLLGYRNEDRREYQFSRGSISWLYDADLWGPMHSWTIVVLLGVLFLLAQATAAVPLLVIAMLDEDAVRDTDVAKRNPVLALFAGSAETIAEDYLRYLWGRLALSVALVWAAHNFMPAMLTLMLVVPPVLGLPWSIRNALRAVKFGKHVDAQVAQRRASIGR